MDKIFTTLVLCIFLFYANAQTQISNVKTPNSTATTQPYGKVDMADLQMTSCDFEKDANAEVLFDFGTQASGRGLYLERHTRIKIFNENGKNEANIRLIYNKYNGRTGIWDLQAETINLENGKIVIVPLDNKLIYTEKIDRFSSALVFALPNVKPGSIIEFKYKQQPHDVWYFQSNLPTRYSEIQTDFSSRSEFRYVPHVSQPFVKDIGEPTDYRQAKALANIHSLRQEEYMGSQRDNLQRMEYISRHVLLNTWSKIGELLTQFSEFGNELDYEVSGAGTIIKQARSLKTVDEKIAFLFDTVKNHMKWNENTAFFVNDGTVKAWNKGTGNSAEINLIVYQLLKKAGVKAYPLVVSSKNNGKINPANPNLFLFNNVVVYIPIDSTKSYVLDATNKFNLYNAIPQDQLNTFGLSVDEKNKDYKMVFLENPEPVMQSVFLNAEVKAGGKLSGTAEITSYSYNKITAAQKYKTDGEEKYLAYLRNNDNNVKISALKMENMEIDSLPLTQKVDFSTDLAGSDENYIYLGTNIFNRMGKNPFTSEERYSDIDFGYRDNYSINGIYKLPAGYKTDALPKTITIVSPDQSMVFKRTIIEDNGTIVVRYMLNHAKTIYFKKDYQDVRGFYKKMYELLNEQIVLKKA